MYNLLKTFVLCAFIATISGCKNSPKATAPKAQLLQGLPLDIKQNLIQKCDYIDYTFYNFDFSMSQADPNAVRSNIALLSDEVQATIPPECKPIGRKYYHINGEIVVEAELYFSENCFFYIYKDDNTTLFGNKLSPAGINFYNNIIQQAGRARQPNG